MASNFAKIAFITVSFLFVFEDAFSCPVGSKGCDRPKPDTAHIFFKVMESAPPNNEGANKLNELSSGIKKVISDLGITEIKVDFSEIFEKRKNKKADGTGNSGVLQFMVIQYHWDGEAPGQSDVIGNLTKIIDAVIGAGATPYTPFVSGSYLHEFPGSENPVMLDKENYYSTDDQSNFVFFTVSVLDPYIDNAIKNALSRVSTVGDAFGKLLKDTAKGVDNIAVSYDAKLRPWKSLTYGPTSFTSDEVYVGVNITGDIHFSHADLKGSGGSNHGHSHEDLTKQSISATGIGSIELPIERALILHRLQVNSEKMSECPELLDIKLKGFKDKLKEEGFADYRISNSGIGLVASERSEYFPQTNFSEILMGQVPTSNKINSKLGCYRDLSINLIRQAKESIDTFSEKVSRAQLNFQSNSTDELDEFMSSSMYPYNNSTKTYYLPDDLSPFVLRAFEGAFEDASLKAKKVGDIRNQKLGEVVSLHPEGNVSLDELLDSIKLKTGYSWENGLSIFPNTIHQRMTTKLTVQYQIE